MLYMPNRGHNSLEDNVGAASAELGVSVTGGGSAHTKNATYTTLIAATAYAAFGITVVIANIAAAATTNTRSLLDIAIGAASSEQVIIPNLICGQAGPLLSASSGPCIYHFPIMIPAGVRISATLQSLAASETAHVSVYLHQHAVPGKWYGQRVTAYGPDTATSTGVSHTHGNGSYAATTQITASTTNPIKYMQLGFDLLTDTTGANKRGVVRIAAMGSTNYVVEGLQIAESTTIETVSFHIANLLLSHMRFNIPAGSFLGVGADMGAAGEARGYAIYGVD
jgi:hypothetical protein